SPLRAGGGLRGGGWRTTDALSKVQNYWLLLRPAVETAPEELELAVHLRGQARPRRWTLGCKPSRGDFNR
ncbi:MAG: hypothetical protein J7M16_12365, partial [Anaerolineae bacterium]|nr:hypothetical protein [Anaerolineae bacterium]